MTAALVARMKVACRDDRPAAADLFRAQLGRLGYPGFAHVTPTRRKPCPDVLLLSVLAQPDADARVVDALPWLVRQYASQMDFRWLVRQAKLQDLQNRLGFVLQMAGLPVAEPRTPETGWALGELERARLLEEATLCWDAMPAATRQWMCALERDNRWCQ